MSIGPAGSLFPSVAGAPLAQASGSEVQRAKQDATAQQRIVDAAEKAEGAAGIAETDGQNHETNERDADGRRPWEIEAKKQSPEDESPADEQAPPPSKDTSGQCGGQLDLTA